MIAFAGTVPENYHRHLGAILFEPYAADLVQRIDRAGRILEIACGTGVVTDAITRRFPKAQIVATDLNPGMIEIAKQNTRAKNIEWRQADAMQLPFADGQFDTVVCQFGLMFVPDKLPAFREARRVLRANGLLLLNVWDSLAENDASRIANDVARAMFRDDPPQFIHMPFSMHDRAEIERLLRTAGFMHVRLTNTDRTMEKSAARQFATGIVRGTPLFDALKERGADFDRVIAAVEKAIREHDGPLRMRAIVAEAR